MEPNLYQIAQFFFFNNIVISRNKFFNNQRLSQEDHVFFKDDRYLSTNNGYPEGEEDLGGTSVFEVLKKGQPPSESQRLQNYEAFLRIFEDPIFPIVPEEQTPRIGI